MSRSTRAAKGFATSVVQYLTQMAVQVLLAPVVLKVAGRETLGAYAAIMQAVSLLALVDLAHSWSLERFLAQSVGLDDEGKRFRCVFTTARTMSLLSNIVFGLLVFAFSFCLGRLFHLSPDIAADGRRALYVIAVWGIVRTPLAAYNNALIAAQDLSACNSIAALLALARGVASLIAVLSGFGLFGLMVGGTAIEAIGMLLYRVRFRRKHSKLLPRWGIPDPVLFRELVVFGAQAMFLNVGNMLTFTSGNALASVVKGAATGSAFYTTCMPGMTGYNMLLRLSDSATPAVNELWGKRDAEKVRRTLVRVLRATLLLAAPLATAVCLFNRDLVSSWVGSQHYAGNLLTCSVAALCLLIPMQHIAMIYAFVIGWVRSLTLTSLLQGFANIGLAFVLGHKLGLGGISLALVVALLPQTVWFWVRLGRALSFNPAVLLSNYMVPILLPLTFASVIAKAVGWALGGPRLYTFLSEAFAFLLVYAVSCYIFALTPEDRRDLRHYTQVVTPLRRQGIPAAEIEVPVCDV